MKRTLLILALLIIVFLSLLLIWKSDNGEINSLRIEFQGKIFIVEDLTVFQPRKIETRRGDLYSGYSLAEILSVFHIDPAELTKLTFASADGAILQLDITELDELFLVLEQNNKSLSIRLVIPDDEFAQRWLKYIRVIKLT